MGNEKLIRQITLFSETDAFGTITFVNDAFCEVSKYNREELIGKPHNIDRHPDMPKRLFELLWCTIKRGEIFRATIKNRAKDDTPYWVWATIMPIFDGNNEFVKYVSVRHLIKDHVLALERYKEQAKELQL